MRVDGNRPVAMKEAKGKWLRVQRVDDVVHAQDRWWSAELTQDRLYFDLVLSDGKQLTVFRDLVRDAWFKQRYA